MMISRGPVLRHWLILCSVWVALTAQAARAGTVSLPQLVDEGSAVTYHDIDADGSLEAIYLDALASSPNPDAIRMFALIDDTGGVMFYLSSHHGPNVYYGWEDLLVGELALETRLAQVISEYGDMLPEDRARADLALSSDPEIALPVSTHLPGLDALHASLRDVWRMREKLALAGTEPSGSMSGRHGFSVYVTYSEEGGPWSFSAHLLDEEGREISDEIRVALDPEARAYVNYDQYMATHDPTWEGGGSAPTAWHPELPKLSKGVFTHVRVVEGRPLVALRPVVNALGGSIQWNASAGTASVAIGGNGYTLWADLPQISVNGEVRSLEAPGALIGGRLYVSLQTVSSVVGYPALAGKKRMIAYVGPC